MKLSFEDQEIKHIGIAKRSGRYPWGSGDNPQQRSREFKSYMDEMKAKGLKEPQILKLLSDYAGVPVRSPDLRAARASSTEYILKENQITARLLKAKQMSNQEIAVQMGLSKSGESTVRGWLNSSLEEVAGSLRATINTLKEHLTTKPFLDVGKGSELWMGISNNKLITALTVMRDEGYNVYPLKTLNSERIRIQGFAF